MAIGFFTSAGTNPFANVRVNTNGSAPYSNNYYKATHTPKVTSSPAKSTSSTKKPSTKKPSTKKSSRTKATGGTNVVNPGEMGNAGYNQDTSSSGSYNQDTSSSGSYDASSAMDDYYAQMQAAAQDAYNRNMSRISDTYDSSLGTLKNNYDSSIGSLGSSYTKSRNDVTQDSEKSLQQAYINKMLQQRNLQQSLSAQGLNGGAAESTQASLANNYGNSRNNINTTTNSNVANLNDTYQQNLASANQQYNSSVSDLNNQRMQAEQSAESALSSMQSGYMANFAPSSSAYLNALNALQSSQSQWSLNRSQATNPYTAASTQQASQASGTNYAKYLAQAASQLATGNNSTAVKNNLMVLASQGALTANELTQIYDQLGIRV